MPSLSAGRPALTLQSGPRDANGRVIVGAVTVIAMEPVLFENGFE